MQIEEFYKRYANTPLADRNKEIDAGDSGKFTLNEIYERVHNIEEFLRPYKITQQGLIDIANKFISPL